MRTLTLLSGGIDSATCLAMYRDTEREAVAFDYGQRHASAELTCAVGIAASEGVPLEIMKVPPIPSINGGVVFAARNAVILSIAASIAASRQIDAVVIGTNQTDWERFPDCRPAFIVPIGSVFAETYGVNLLAPLLRKSKRQVVEIARQLGVPLERTWSCYEPANGAPCGSCLACTVRRDAMTTERA